MSGRHARPLPLGAALLPGEREGCNGACAATPAAAQRRRLGEARR